MFSDRPASKIKKILMPFVIWLIAGAAAEIIGVIAVGILMKKGVADVPSNLLFMLEEAHARFEYPMLIFRNIASFPFLVRMFRADNARISVNLPVLAPYIERVEFFHRSLAKGMGDSENRRKRQAAKKIVWFFLFILPGIFYAFAGNLVLHYTGLTAESSAAEVPPFTVWVLLFELIAAPVLEELLCRGLIYRSMRTYMGILKALFFSAVCFGIFHLDPVQSLYAFVFGLVLADLYEISGSLAAVVLTHMAANAIGLLVTYVPAVNQFVLTNGIPVLIVSLVLTPVSVVLIGLTAGKEK